MPLSNLIYIYKDVSIVKKPELDSLKPDRLLLPPIFTNRKAWTIGYFETVDNRPVGPSDMLPQHCFHDFTGQYLDLEGQPLPGPVEPCGDWVLSSYRWIDDHISDALGFPRVAD
jgi:Immunity protein 26